MPFNLTKINRHLIYREFTVDAVGGKRTDKTVGEAVLHELELFAAGPADLDLDLVDVRAASASQGQLRRGQVQEFGKIELGEIGSLGAGATCAAGGIRYTLADTQVEILDFDPAGMPSITAFTFNSVDVDERIEWHCMTPLIVDSHRTQSLPRAAKDDHRCPTLVVASAASMESVQTIRPPSIPPGTKANLGFGNFIPYCAMAVKSAESVFLRMQSHAARRRAPHGRDRVKLKLNVAKPIEACSRFEIPGKIAKQAAGVKRYLSGFRQDSTLAKKGGDAKAVCIYVIDNDLARVFKAP